MFHLILVLKLITKYFIVLPHEVKEQFSNHANHYGNDISVVSTHKLVGDYFTDYEWDRNKVFNRGIVLGAHMAGHLLSNDYRDIHCKDPSCCMHPHMKGITAIDEIIESRKTENRKELFCEDSLKQFREYLEILKK